MLVDTRNAGELTCAAKSSLRLQRWSAMKLVFQALGEDHRWFWDHLNAEVLCSSVLLKQEHRAGESFSVRQKKLCGLIAHPSAPPPCPNKPELLQAHHYQRLADLQLIFPSTRSTPSPMYRANHLYFQSIQHAGSALLPHHFKPQGTKLPSAELLLVVGEESNPILLPDSM